MSTNLTATIASALTKLDELDKLTTSRASGDLEQRMKYRTMCSEIRKALQESLIAVTQKAVDEAPQAGAENAVATHPVAEVPPSTVAFVRTDVATATKELTEAVTKHQELLELLAKHIPNVDKEIVSINTILPAGQQAKKTFDKSVHTLLCIYSTNTEAYVLARSNRGTLSVSPHKYWIQERA